MDSRERVSGEVLRKVGEHSDEGMMLYQCLYVHSLDLTYIQHTSSLIETLPLPEQNITRAAQPRSNFSYIGLRTDQNVNILWNNHIQVCIAYFNIPSISSADYSIT